MFQLDDNENIKLHQRKWFIEEQRRFSERAEVKNPTPKNLSPKSQPLIFSWLSAMLAVLTPTSTPEKIELKK